MKKRLMSFLLVGVMAFFVVPALTTTVSAAETMNVAIEQDISPHTEMTRIALRTYNGVLEFRVWSITNGRWLTEWAPI